MPGDLAEFPEVSDRRVLNAAARLKQRLGRPPTVREVMRELKWRKGYHAMRAVLLRLGRDEGLRLSPAFRLGPDGLTETQRRVLDFMRAFLVERQRTPALREIAVAFGWASLTAARNVLAKLAAKGRVKLNARKLPTLVGVELTLARAKK